MITFSLSEEVDVAMPKDDADNLDLNGWRTLGEQCGFRTVGMSVKEYEHIARMKPRNQTIALGYFLKGYQEGKLMREMQT